MAGGGNILSKKALEKFATVIVSNATLCRDKDDKTGDFHFGACLSKYAIFHDARDEKNQKQIFPIGVKFHLDYKKLNMSIWYFKTLWRNVTNIGLGCCSDVHIASHYTKPKEINLLEFLIYHVHPFGLEKNLTETLPRKLSLDEIIKDSDVGSIFSPNYKEHEIIHYIDEDEKYDV